MTTIKQKTLLFYKNLGKLFYAIAAADNEVRDVELDKLKELVKKYWLEADIVNGIYISDAAYQIEIIFDWLNKEKKIDAKTCYHDFVRYKKAQSHLFTDTVKKLILKTAHAIAASFSGLNKSELIMLAKLDLEFKKTGL